jgi:hypothetical protein
MRITKTKVASVLAVTAVVALGGTAAMAYWTSNGSGTGTATTAAGASNLAVTQTAAPTNMAPGITAGAVTVDVTNNAVNRAFVSQVVVSIASVSGGAGSCDATDYVLTGATLTNGAGELLSGATAHFSGASLGFNDKTSNQDGCKGATVNLAYAVS